MIVRADIEAAALRIRKHVLRTPVLTVEAGDIGLRHPVTLKLELMQHSGSFKARGAFNALLSHNPGASGVVAASGGNHGAAVAFAASRLQVPARVFVPEIAGPTKIGLIRSAGVEPDVVRGAYADAFEASEAVRRETGAMTIHAYDGPETVAGQGTLGPEIERQIEDLDILLVAVGGGGLIGGVSAWFGERVRIVGVEPVRAQTLTAALKNGPETDVDVSGIAANALGARRIGRLGYDICKANAVETVVVDDEDIATAQKLLWQSARVLAEPGGATALAALTSGKFVPPRYGRVGVLVCGGNVDPTPFP